MTVDDSNRGPEGTTIVIDALDECTHENEKLLELIVELCAEEDSQVCDLFVEKSRSTFLWVALAPERLFDKEIEAWQILDTLKGLPSGFKQLYKRMMQDIKESNHLPQCKDILTVAALAYRPMSLAELPSSAQSLLR
ncbi:hypothetical protein ACHAQK_011627 [Fusarium lateritium]